MQLTRELEQLANDLAAATGTTPEAALTAAARAALERARRPARSEESNSFPVLRLMEDGKPYILRLTGPPPPLDETAQRERLAQLMAIADRAAALWWHEPRSSSQLLDELYDAQGLPR